LCLPPATQRPLQSSNLLYLVMPSSSLSALVLLLQMMEAASARLGVRQDDWLLDGMLSNTSNLAGYDLAYDYSGLATSAYNFDNEEASHKPWIRGILQKFEALNTAAAREIHRRNSKSSSLTLHGPRTFVLTVGGPGNGKSYALNEILDGTNSLGLPLGPRADFVVMTADEIREDSPAFREILRMAKTENKSLPRNLVQDSNLEFLVRGRMRNGKNWLQLGGAYLQTSALRNVFKKHGKTSIVYDTMCATAGFCERILLRARRAGYERLALFIVNVDPDCAVYRAGKLRAHETGRTVPEEFVRSAHKSANDNVPLLIEEAKKLIPDGWLIVTSSPKQGSPQDEHHCPTKTEYTLEAA